MPRTKECDAFRPFAQDELSGNHPDYDVMEQALLRILENWLTTRRRWGIMLSEKAAKDIVIVCDRRENRTMTAEDRRCAEVSERSDQHI